MKTDVYIIPSIEFSGYILTVKKGKKEISIYCATQEEAFLTLENNANEINCLLGEV